MTARFSSMSFVAGVIAGVLLSGIWFATSPDDLFSLSTAFKFSPDAPKRALAEPSTAIQVVDQEAGGAVAVASVDVSAPVWVAVRELTDRDLGNVLGAVRIGGPRTDIVVPLLRETVPGQTYAVMLYRDDAAEPFDPARYSVYVDFSSGARVVAYFNTKH